jgi:hypothetical protein
MNTGEHAMKSAHPRVLTAVLVLQVLTLLGLWTGHGPLSGAAAAIPDPGAQREALVAEQKATNQKLDKLIDLLRSGDVKVKVESKQK